MGLVLVRRHGVAFRLYSVGIHRSSLLTSLRFGCLTPERRGHQRRRHSRQFSRQVEMVELVRLVWPVWLQLVINCVMRGEWGAHVLLATLTLSFLLTCKNLSCRSGESPAMNHFLCPGPGTGFSALHLRLASAPRYNMRRDLVVILQLVERLHNGSRRKILFHHDFAEFAVLLILLWRSQSPRTLHRKSFGLVM